MTDDGAWYSPKTRKPPIRRPRAGELLYEFMRDHTHVRVELRDRGSWGVEAQIFLPGDFRMGQRFETRALAVQWAEPSAKGTKDRPAADYDRHRNRD